MSTQPDEPTEPTAREAEPVSLEEDETVPPRPEEEIADELRANPT
ncbi:hypothetical protein AA0Y32_09330 [Georgenia phoenicis]